MPCRRCLLKTIESFDHTTKMLWLRRINKPRWLTHVLLLILKNTMEESVLNIKLAKMPDIHDREQKKQMNSSRFDNRTESVIIIETIPLLEPFCHKPRLVPFNRTIRAPLHFEDLLRINNINARAEGDQGPCLILQESLKFQFHSLAPVRDAESILISSGLNGRINNTMSMTSSEPCDSTIGALFVLNDSMLTAREHARWSRIWSRCSRSW
jgi:hypothetical protein